MSKKAKKTKQTESIDVISLKNQLDSQNTLLMNALNEINTMKQQVQNLSTNFTFHSHDTALRTGAPEFNKVLYDQWVASQQAALDAQKKAREEEEGKPNE